MPIKTTIVPEPEEGTVVFGRSTGKGLPLFSGNDKSGANIVCGSCDAVLIENAASTSTKNVVLKCPSCGSFSEVLSG